MNKNAILFLSLLCLIVSSCSSDSEGDIMEPDDTGGEVTVTYTDDIAPIISANCLGCHTSPPQNGAPFSLVNFDQVDSRSSSILAAVDAGIMPPSGKLPQNTIDLIAQWIDEGKPE